MNSWELLIAVNGAADADLEAVQARLGLTQKRTIRRGSARVLLAAAVAAALLLATLGVAMAASPTFRETVFSIFHIQTPEPAPEIGQATENNGKLWNHLELEDAAEIDYYTLRTPFTPVTNDALYHWDAAGGCFYRLTDSGFEEIAAHRMELDVTFGGAEQHIVYDWAQLDGEYLLGWHEDERMNENPYGYGWMLSQPDPASSMVWLVLPDWNRSYAACPFLLNLETGEWTDVLQGMEYERFHEDLMPSWRFSSDLQHLLLMDESGLAWLYDTVTHTETDLSGLMTGAMLDAGFYDAETIVFFSTENESYSFTWYSLADGATEQRSYSYDRLQSVIYPFGKYGIERSADGRLALVDLRSGIGAPIPAYDPDCVFLLNDDETRLLRVDRRLEDKSGGGALAQTFTGFSVCDLKTHTVVRLDREPGDAEEWSVFWLDNERFAVWAENPAEGFADVRVYHLHQPGE